MPSRWRSTLSGWAVVAGVMARRRVTAAASSWVVAPLTPPLHRRPTAAMSGMAHYSPSGRSTVQRCLTLTAAAARKSSADNATKTQSRQRPFHLVIVESPSKCATIDKILRAYVQDNNLPHDYRVEACYGHVRDLAKKKTATNVRTGKGNVNTGQRTWQPPYDIAGIDVAHNYQPIYETLPSQRVRLAQLADLAAKAQQVVLATDPDREGEAMAFHLRETLQLSHYRRVSFGEITASAIVNSIQHDEQHDINPHLVRSQETRRMLDRLTGYTVSPLLWRKISPGLSAGRVQSVALAMIVQRERQRLRFATTHYNSVVANFQTPSPRHSLQAVLAAVNDQTVASRTSDFAAQGQCLAPTSRHKLHLQQSQADELVEIMLHDPSATFVVTNVTSTTRRTAPPSPYRTATLQQDAQHRLGMSIASCMQVAQKLYEKGHITYMRTDSVALSRDAQTALDQVVRQRYNRQPPTNRSKTATNQKKSTSKFAQEAHEAIRPVVSGNEVSLTVSDATLAPLYKLIYQRSIASRMPSLVTNTTRVMIQGTTVNATDGRHLHVDYVARGSVVLDPGFTAAYEQQQQRGQPEDDDGFNDDDRYGGDQRLPRLNVGDALTLHDLQSRQHTTQPPPRYSEASLVKELEGVGVGRPSTYTRILQVLRQRAYVSSPPSKSRPSHAQQRHAVRGGAISAQRAAGGGAAISGGRGALVPSLSAFCVTALLEQHCRMLVDADFTAGMEATLDRIARGTESNEDQRLAYLNQFYGGDNGLAMQVKHIDDNFNGDVLRRTNLPSLDSNATTIGVYVGPWGPYVQSSSPEGKSQSASLPPELAGDLSAITPDRLETLLSLKTEGGVLLGSHPHDGRPIRLKAGRYGLYLQWGDDNEDGTTTHTLPREKAFVALSQTDDSMSTVQYDADDDELPSMPAGSITMDEAVGYVGLPRTVSTLNGLNITTAIGPYGPYLKYNSSYVSLNARYGDDVLTIAPERAEQLVKEHIVNNGVRNKPRGVVTELGKRSGAPLVVKAGRFGKYISWKEVNAKLPEGYLDDPSQLPLDDAWALIEAKADGNSKNGKTKEAAKKTTKASKLSADSRNYLPSPPKRPMSAYMHFCAAQRAQSETSLSMFKLATLWASVTDEEKMPFALLAAQEKTNFTERKAAWQDECQRIEMQQSSAAKSGRRNSSPSETATFKRPKSAYLYFCDEHRAAVAEQCRTPAEVMKELSRQWRATTDRLHYEQLAAVDKARHEKEKAALLTGALQ